MKRFLVYLFLFAFLPGVGMAQTRITGKVVDTSGVKPVEFATIALQRVKDSSIVTSTVADMNGAFELKKVQPGNYIVSVSHMSYAPATKNVTVGTSPVALGSIKMNSKDVRLKEVVVSGKSTPIAVKKDTVEFNIIAYKPRQNDVVEDVLKKLPGVTVDADGKVLVNGKEVKEVMVDGKKFFMNDPKLATQNLPADIVERIQLVDKKSDQAEFSKIDDGETEKIINLTLKKGTNKGYFTNARLGFGTDDTYDASLRLIGFEGSTQLFSMGNYNNINRGGRGGGRSVYPNVRQSGIQTTGSGAFNLSTMITPKVTANGSYNFSYNDNSKASNTVADNYDQTGMYKSDKFSSSDSYSRSHNIFARFEYQIDSSNSIWFMPNMQLSNSNTTSSTDSHMYSSDGDLLNSEKVDTRSDSENKNFGINLLYRKSLKKPRQTFSIQFSGRSTDNSGNQYTVQENYYAKLDSTNFRNQHVVTSNKNDDYSARLVYTQPLSKLWTLEGNYRIGYSNATRDNNAYDYVDGRYSNIVNSFYTVDYKNENVRNTLGTRLNMSTNKVVANIGLNGSIINQDYRNRKGENLLDTSMTYRTISPSFVLSYNPADNKSFVLNYSGNSSQPSVDQIHPVQDPTTPNNILLGNNSLKSQFSNTITVSYDYFDPVSFWSISNVLDAGQTSNAIVDQTYRGNILGKTYSKSINLDGKYNIGNYFTVGKSLFNNKLQTSSTTDVTYSHTPGAIGLDEELKSSDEYFTNNLSLGESLRGNLALDFLEVGADVGYNYSIVNYEGLESINAVTQKDRNYSTLSVGGNATAYLPWSLELNSTINFSKYFGDMASESNNSVLWNASATCKLLRDKSLSLSLIAFDILDKYRPFSRTVSANRISETTSKAISQMFMVSVSFTLNKFGGNRPKQNGMRPGGMPGGMQPGRMPQNGGGMNKGGYPGMGGQNGRPMMPQSGGMGGGRF